MTKYVVFIEDGAAFVAVEADDVDIGEHGSLEFLIDEWELVAYFPAGSYNFFYKDGVAEIF